MHPFNIKMSYLGRPWCTVSLEVGHNEIGDADEPDSMTPPELVRMIEELGFTDLKALPIMPLHYQIAQKIHGASEPGSRRAHDLIDLQVIVQNGDVDLALTRRTCERLFAYRNTHSWPPTVEKGEEWESLYAAQLLPSILQTADEAVAWVNNIIKTIAGI